MNIPGWMADRWRRIVAEHTRPWCPICQRPRCWEQAEARGQLIAHDLPLDTDDRKGVDPMNTTTYGERPAELGEVCTCGRPAVKVFTAGRFGDTGYCGLPDGGRKGPCPFCGGPRHESQRCPDYQLRPQDDRPNPTAGEQRRTA